MKVYGRVYRRVLDYAEIEVEIPESEVKELYGDDRLYFMSEKLEAAAFDPGTEVKWQHGETEDVWTAKEGTKE